MASLLTSSTVISHVLTKPHLHKPTLPRLNSTLSFSHLSYPSLRTSTPKFNPLPSIKASPSSTTLQPHPTPNPSKPNNPFPSTLLSNSTRSLTTLFSIALSLSNLISQAIQRKITSFSITPSPQELDSIKKLQGNLVCTVGPLFFAAVRDRPDGLNTPFTVVAAGMSKWLDIYSGVLMVRVLLSWFPNIPWDRQPLSAIRDLCDPYLNLFRNIIPPVFDTLDVSPLLAFAVLGVLGAILNGGKGAY